MTLRPLLLSLLLVGCAATPVFADSDCLKAADLNHGVLIKGLYVPGGMKARQAAANRFRLRPNDYDQLVLGARCQNVTPTLIRCVNPCGRVSSWASTVPDGVGITSGVEATFSKTTISPAARRDQQHDRDAFYTHTDGTPWTAWDWLRYGLLLLGAVGLIGFWLGVQDWWEQRRWG